MKEIAWSSHFHCICLYVTHYFHFHKTLQNDIFEHTWMPHMLPLFWSSSNFCLHCKMIQKCTKKPLKSKLIHHCFLYCIVLSYSWYVRNHDSFLKFKLFQLQRLEKSISTLPNLLIFDIQGQCSYNIFFLIRMKNNRNFSEEIFTMPLLVTASGVNINLLTPLFPPYENKNKWINKWTRPKLRNIS